MPRIKVTLRSGATRLIEGRAGQSLKEALIAGGIEEIEALTSCGGCCSCGTCHVFIDPRDLERLAPMQSQEDDLLNARDDRRPTSRLSCQVRLTDELEELSVIVAPEW